MKEETAEQAAARRAADAERKRGSRKKEREQKERIAVAKKLAEATTFPEYWQQQRATLTDDQRAQFEQRESDVLDLEFAMRKYVDGVYEQTTDTENRVPLEAIKEEVQLEIQTHGLLESIVLIVDRLWGDEEKDLRERIARKSDATAKLVQYGYRLAIDSSLHERFRQFMTVSQPNAGSGYVWMQCECHTPITSREWIQKDIAESYRARAMKWLCGPCRGKENNSRAQAVGVEYRRPASTEDIYDSYGRLRDQ